MKWNITKATRSLPNRKKSLIKHILTELLDHVFFTTSGNFQLLSELPHILHSLNVLRIFKVDINFSERMVRMLNMFVDDEEAREIRRSVLKHSNRRGTR